MNEDLVIEPSIEEQKEYIKISNSPNYEELDRRKHGPIWWFVKNKISGKNKNRFFPNKAQAEETLKELNITNRKLFISCLEGGCIYLGNDEEKTKFIDILEEHCNDASNSKPHFSQIAYDFSRIVIDLDVEGRDLDMDWLRLFTVKLLEEIKSHYDLQDELPCIYISKSGPKPKNNTIGCGLHIIVHLESSIVDSAQFIYSLKESGVKELDMNGVTLDTTIYKLGENSVSLRMLYSQKHIERFKTLAWENYPPLVSTHVYEPFAKCIDGNLDYDDTRKIDNHQIWNYGSDIKDIKFHLPSNRKRMRNVEENPKEIIKDDKKSKIIDFVRKQWGWTPTSISLGLTDNTYWIFGKERNCPFYKNKHRGKTQMVVISEFEGAKLLCASQKRCKGHFQISPIPFDLQNLLFPKFSYVEFRTDHSVQPLDEEIEDSEDEGITLRKKIKCLLIEAGMAMEKTRTILKYLQDRQHKYARMIVVCNRRQQGETSIGKLQEWMPEVKWHDYREDMDITKCDHLVIEYESLHRLAFTKPFGFVFLDECRSTQGCATSLKTNHRNLNVNDAILTQICCNSRLTIMADAHASLDLSCTNFMNRIFNQEEIKHLVYTHHKIKRDVVVYEKDASVLPLLFEDIEAGLKVGIICRSATWVNILYQMFIEAGVDPTKILRYTGDCPNSEIANFKNIEKILKENQTQILIFSPVITTGADISNVEFHRIYAFGKSKQSCTFRDFMQMSGRFRWVSTNQLVFMKKSGNTKKPRQFILNDLMKKEDVRKRYMQHIIDSHCVDGFEFQNDVLCPITKNPHMLEQFLLNEMEKEADFNVAFLDLCAKSEYTIIDGIEDDSLEEWLVTTKTRIKKMFNVKTKDNEVKALKKMQQNPYLADTAKLDIQSGKDVDPIDKIAIKFNTIAKSLKDFKNFDVKDINQLKRKPKSYERLKILVNAKIANEDPMNKLREICYAKDADNMMYTQPLSETKLLGGPVEELNKALMLVGYQSPVDFKNMVSDDCLQQHWKQIKILLDQCAELNSEIPSYDTTETSAKYLRRELRNVLDLNLKHIQTTDRSCENRNVYLGWRIEMPKKTKSLLDKWSDITPTNEGIYERSEALKRKQTVTTKSKLEQEKQKKVKL